MRNVVTFLIVIGIVIAGFYFYGPAHTSPIPKSIEVQTPHTVTARVLDEGTHAGGISIRKNYVGYAEEGLRKIWGMAHGTDGTPLPKVDFSKEYVIGIFAGQKPTGGYSIAVASVIEAGDTRTVGITITKPGEGCMVTQALTNPYQIAILPLSSATLTHKDTEVAKPCN